MLAVVYAIICITICACNNGPMVSAARKTENEGQSCHAGLSSSSKDQPAGQTGSCGSKVKKIAEILQLDPDTLPPPIYSYMTQTYAYSEPRDFTLGHLDGHDKTVQVQMKNIKDFFCAGPLLPLPGQEIYKLHKLHFDWSWNNDVKDYIGDEHHHFFDDREEESPILQAHFIHFNGKFGNVRKAMASGEAKALAIIVVYFQNNGIRNEALDPIIEKLELLKTNRTASGTDLFLRELFLIPETNKMKAIQYVGSLGSANSNSSDSDQLVLWTIGTEPLDINAEQLDEFRKLQGHPSEGQQQRPSVSRIIRPVVPPLNGRKPSHYEVQVGYIMSYGGKY